jgi:hypothetical protein
MDVEELKMITSVTTGCVEIWVEVNGKKIPVRDYEMELEDNRIILKP